MSRSFYLQLNPFTFTLYFTIGVVMCSVSMSQPSNHSRSSDPVKWMGHSAATADTVQAVYHHFVQ